MAKVVFEKVYKSFPRRQADPREQGANSSPSSQVNILRNIDLKVNDGEFMVLVGPSGCGKSTLLRLLAGLEELTAGNISIGDRVVNQIAPKSRDIAMVFQNYALYPHLNVYDNIAFGLRRSETGRRGDGGATPRRLETQGNAHRWETGSGQTPRRRQTQTPVPSSRGTRPTDWLGNVHQERLAPFSNHKVCAIRLAPSFNNSEISNR